MADPLKAPPASEGSGGQMLGITVPDGVRGGQEIAIEHDGPTLAAFLRALDRHSQRRNIAWNVASSVGLNYKENGTCYD